MRKQKQKYVFNPDKLPEILGSTGRLRILEALFNKKRLHVALIAKQCGLNPSTTKEHLEILEKAKLVGYEKVGKKKEYFLAQNSPQITAISFLFKKWKATADDTLYSDALGRFRIVDLTHEIVPTSEIASHLQEWQRNSGISEISTPGAKDFREGALQLGFHTGTHVDVGGTVPKYRETPAIAELDIRKFVGPAVSFNVTPKKELVRKLISKKDKSKLSLIDMPEDEISKLLMDLEIKPEDIDTDEIRTENFVLFYTGFDEFWYPGAERPFFRWEPYFIHPYLGKQIVDMLVEKKICGVGIDTATMEPPFYYQKEGEDLLLDRVVHRIKEKDPSCFTDVLYAHNRLLKDSVLIENLAHLGELAQKRFTFMCLPLKLDKTNIASPVRAVAIESM